MVEETIEIKGPPYLLTELTNGAFAYVRSITFNDSGVTVTRNDDLVPLTVGFDLEARTNDAIGEQKGPIEHNSFLQAFHAARAVATKKGMPYFAVPRGSIRTAPIEEDQRVVHVWPRLFGVGCYGAD